MNRTTTTFAAAFALLLAQNSIACEQPAAISIPDGSNATVEEMNTAGDAFHRYMTDMQIYQTCIENEANTERMKAEDLGKTELKQQEDKYAALHNSASDEMAQAAKAFDEAVKVFKARQ